jgi:murein DD-endopeptidase MepM/ murein hydrolase activator NlpD
MRKGWLVWLLALLAPAGMAAAQPAPEPPPSVQFSLPIDCRIGEVCIVQNYVDVESGPGAKDPWCGPLTYQNHVGLDFRAPAALAREGVRVLAPAAGIVRALRDGEDDGVYQAAGRAGVQGRECGNGVVIEHAGGWSSQLCHMRKGTIVVARGDQVESGTPVGTVGLSGQTEFPHVHLTLRRNGEAIEAYSGAAIAGATCTTQGPQPGPHWTPEARAQLGYRGSRWFAAGFTGEAPAQGANVETLPANAGKEAQALVFWALASGPRSGDMLRIRVFDPDGEVVAETSRPQPRDQAQASVFAGRRMPEGGWKPGTYRGEARLERGIRVLDTRTVTIVVP